MYLKPNNELILKQIIMLKSILAQQGVHQLNKEQQQVINGGGGLNSECHSDSECDYPLICAGCLCRPVGGPF